MTTNTIIDCLTEIPAVSRYLNRIGAVPISLRRAAVYEFDGQYRADVAKVRFDNAGTVAAEKGYEPTEAEQTSITAEWPNYRWPEYHPAISLTINPPKEWQGKDDDLFVLRARTRHNGQDKRSDLPILMVHQRVPNEDGGKDYWCWTHYDDGQWRRMEPPESLPLYGLDKLNGKATVFLHEGAKAARECERLSEKGAHPWKELGLSDSAHLGWLGGAKAVHKTDWSELGKAGISRVVIVADNDDPGKAVIRKISKALSGFEISVEALQFTDDFPPSFDLGDKLDPKTSPSLFKKDAQGKATYIGPSYRELIRPATWATAPNPMATVGGRGRPAKQTYRLREIFLKEWWMVKTVKGPIFISRHDRGQLFTEQAFATMTRALADCSILDLFKAQAFARTFDAVAYEPGQKVEIIVEGRREINTWVPSRIRPAECARPEDWKFWLEFLEHLFPSADERKEVMRWVATLIARPEVRMLYAMLLYSRMQGVGKTTLCEIIRVLVGEHNSRCPSAHDVVNGSFNGWLVRKRFIFVNEIYESGNLKAYDILKTYITDGNIEANEKMIPQYSVANRTHYIFCSNSEAPLAIDKDDRRIFAPTVTEQKWSSKEWGEFYGHLNVRGYEAIAAWAECFVEKHGAVEAGARAPDTERKRQLIDDSRSRMEHAVADLANLAQQHDHGNGLKGAVLVMGDVEEWLKDKFPKNKLPPRSMVRRWLRESGMIESEKRFRVEGQLQYTFSSRAIGNDGWSDMKGFWRKPEDLFCSEESM